MKEKMILLKNVSNQENPPDELAQKVSKTNRTKFSFFLSKVQNLTLFSIIYMIRIRFFGPRELIQRRSSDALGRRRLGVSLTNGGLWFSMLGVLLICEGDLYVALERCGLRIVQRMCTPVQQQSPSFDLRCSLRLKLLGLVLQEDRKQAMYRLALGTAQRWYSPQESCSTYM